MRELANPIGYLEQLRQNRKTAQAKRAAITNAPPLHERIQEWYNALPCEEKSQVYTMREFRALFGESPQMIGAALFALGWSRKRMWRDDRPTARYWFRSTL